MGVNERMLAHQRLHGSCPWVFAYDGGEMRFITEFIWRTALGLRINAPDDAPFWLVASGSGYPTDSSINLAISQGDHPLPRGLQLEVPDGEGGWVVAEPDLGFPAGKTKTILVDLDGVFRPGTPRRVRLRTNVEISWDRLAWAEGYPEAELRTARLAPAAAELRYRGFSAVHQTSRRAPELPDYGTIASTAPLWRDLEGFHTPFGDVLPLIDSIDGRYVIMNAGDELALRFPELAPPGECRTRTWVLVGDGWVKDGDYNYNTTFSRTVLPLP